MPRTYDLIQDLVLVIDYVDGTNNNFNYMIRINQSNGMVYWYEGQSNYSTTMVRVNSNTNAFYPNYSTNIASTYGSALYMDILDYTSTAGAKPFFAQNINMSSEPRADNQLWGGTFSFAGEAITRIDIIQVAGTLSNINASLYGITRA
jgi:hypothetical protein